MVPMAMSSVEREKGFRERGGGGGLPAAAGNPILSCRERGRERARPFTFL